MRVLTYNVRSLKQDRRAVVEIVRSVDPDVLALQEPPKWWRGRARLRRLADDCGLEVAVPGGLRGARTCAVLVRPGTRVVARRAVRLPLRVVGRQHWYPTLRGAALVVLDPADPAGRLVLASVHLSLDPRERAEHLARIEDALSASAVEGGIGWDRAVVAGDLNEGPGGPAWRAFAARGLRDLAVDDLPTFSTTAPRRRLDVVLAGAILSGSSRRVGGGGSTSDVPPRSVAAGSDHFPVVADLTTEQPARGIAPAPPSHG